jgi:hypothetical protein
MVLVSAVMKSSIVPELRLGMLASLLAAAPAAAQHRFSVYGDLGAASSLADLTRSGSASLKASFFLGGGLNWQVVPNDSSLVLQGDVMWVPTTLHKTGPGSGTRVNLTFVGANLEYTWIQTRRFEFTISGGGGAVAVYARDTIGVVRVRPFARLGLGARHAVKRSLHVFVQGFGTVYDLQNFPSTSVLGPYIRRQSVVGIGAGVAVRL